MIRTHTILISLLALYGVSQAESQTSVQISGHRKWELTASQDQRSSNASTNQASLLTLSDLLARTPWNVKKNGSMLVVNPAGTLLADKMSVPENVAGLTLYEVLPLFRRQLLKAGKLTVIAPSEMEVIKDTPHELPNFYDGLPRELKTNYLLATLTDEQWKQLGQSGLGLRDMTQEQASVYLSLLPNPFRINRWQLTDNGDMTSSNVDVLTLTPELRTQVKLYIQRKARFDVPYVDTPNSYTSVQVQGLPGKPHGVKLTPNWNTEYEKNTLFGVAPKALLPNRLKPSDVNYASARLNPAVNLSGITNIGELITRIGMATHLELYADPRVATLPIKMYGDQVRSGDALKALALAVTGTYRIVDTAYLLTSDLSGIATRQLRWSEWQAQNKSMLKERQKEWIRLIKLKSGPNSGINALGYSPDDPYALTPSIGQAVRDRLRSGDRVFSASQLTPAIRQLLQDNAEREASQYPDGRRQSSDKAQIWVTYNLAFQLPDGAMIYSEEPAVGWESEYLPKVEKQNSIPNSAKARPETTSFALPVWARERWLIIAPENADEASHCVQDAIGLGFTNIVLRTEDKVTLDAAIAVAHAAAKQATIHQVHVFAAVAPFSYGPQTEVNERLLDRNLMGETASQVAAIRQKQPRWRNLVHGIISAKTADIVPEALLGATSALAPILPGIESRFQNIARLAENKGLAGMFLYDTQPGGYAGKHSSFGVVQSQTGNDVALIERENLGYIPALRLSLLRRTGFDPLDLTPVGLHLDIDLLTPFFPDDQTCYDFSDARLEGVRVTAQMETASQQWDKLRGQANRDAMTNLYMAVHSAAPGLALYMTVRAESNDDVNNVRYLTRYMPWIRPESLPTATGTADTEFGKPNGKPQMVFIMFSESGEVSVHTALLEHLARLQKPDIDQMNDTPIAFDFSHIPAQRALEMLKACISTRN